MPGPAELLLILLIVLVIFGAGKLPAIGDALGRSIKNFKRSVSAGNEIEVGKRDELRAGGARGEIGAGRDDDDEVDDAEVVARPAATAKAPKRDRP
jgi:sec-independent protein translocase protein TatA